MKDPRGDNNQIMLLHTDTQPLILQTPHIEKPFAFEDIPYLLILMQMFVEEHFDFFLIHLPHLFGAHGDLVAVLVGAVRGDFVDGVDRGAVVVQHPEMGELRGGDGAAGVVGFALIALFPPPQKSNCQP